MNGMPVDVYAQWHPTDMGVSVWMVCGNSVGVPEDGDIVFYEHSEGEYAPPTFRLPVQAARALVAALASAVNTPITDVQREDYLHERQRVDTMLEVILRRMA